MKSASALLLSAILAAQGNFADQEVPVGLTDGVNCRFTLAHIPNPLSSVAVHVNGLLQKKGLDFEYTAFVSEGKGTVLFNPCCAPPAPMGTGDHTELLVDYRY
jgi:hypothetical protein